jgi:hypothetical protein
VTFLLHIHHPSGTVQTVPFASAFQRALVMISLAAQPVILRLEDRS